MQVPSSPKIPLCIPLKQSHIRIGTAAERAAALTSVTAGMAADGATQVQVLDASGKSLPIDRSRIINPTLNLSGAQP